MKILVRLSHHKFNNQWNVLVGSLLKWKGDPISGRMNLNLEEKLRQQSKRWRNRLETLLLPKPRNNGFLINWKRYRIPMGTRLVLTFLNSLKNQRLKKKKKKKKKKRMRRRRKRTVSRLPDPVLSISLHMDSKWVRRVQLLKWWVGLGGGLSFFKPPRPCPTRLYVYSYLLWVYISYQFFFINSMIYTC